MAAQQSPAEFAREVFEYDSQVMKHLIFRESDSIDNETLSPESFTIAELILNQRQIFHYDPGRLVMELWELDENKKTAVALLKGEE